MMQQVNPASHDLRPRRLRPIEGPTTLLSENPSSSYWGIATERSQSQGLCRLCLMGPFLDGMGPVPEWQSKKGVAREYPN